MQVIGNNKKLSIPALRNCYYFHDSPVSVCEFDVLNDIIASYMFSKLQNCETEAYESMLKKWF